MKNKTFVTLLTVLFAAGAWVLTGQQNTDITGVISKGEKPRIAVPDFRA